MKKIEELCSRIVSITSRSGLGQAHALRPEFTGVLTARHISRDGLLDVALGFSEHGTDAEAQHVVKPGDVAVVARAANLTQCFAAIVPEHEGTLVASTSVLALRPNRHLFGPYLVAFVNAGHGRLFSRVLKGANIGALGWGEVRKLEIPLPPFEQQQKIAGVYETAERLIKLRTQSHKLMLEMVRALAHTKDQDYVAPPKPQVDPHE